MTDLKGERRHALKNRLSGHLEHLQAPSLYVFAMTYKLATAANHIIELVHRIIGNVSASRLLQEILYVQEDNRTLEKKMFLFTWNHW